MNYETLSDFEINYAVYNFVNELGYSMEFLGCDSIKWSTGGGECILTGKCRYTKSGLRDYCNNPSDAWPIIIGNGIGLLDPELCGSINNWCAVKFIASHGVKAVEVYHKNPLRAAMIVFLMMQEAKRG